MRQSLQHRLQQNQNTIDLSPLIDVVFILLIFFIVTSAFVREAGVEVDKPQAVTSSQLNNNIILLAVTAQGKVVYDGQFIGISGIRNTLLSLLKKRQRSIVIQADKSVTTELLVKVIDEAKLAGAQTVNIATLVR